MKAIGALLLALVLGLPLATESSSQTGGVLLCMGRVVTIRGTPGDDVLRGTAAADVIHGLGGDDRLEGLGGDDVLCGGAGDDILIGGAGRDRLHGGGGRDRLWGGPGGDRLYGGPGNDRLHGGGGPDHLHGGRGRDRAVGDAGDDACDAEFRSGCEAATHYVRADGGNRSQCLGSGDHPYPGVGLGHPCAWDHPFRALPPQGTPRLGPGDTLLIGPGSYRMGPGAPRAGGCDPAAPWDCRLPPLPSGTSAARPTRVLGAGGPSCRDAPELWGSGGARSVLDLTGASHVEVGCLEVTDHAACVEHHSGGLACDRERPGAWASIGLYAQDSRDVRLHHLTIHGLASAGVAAGRLTDWTVEDTAIRGNGWVGWEGDIEGDDGNHGRIVLRRVRITWNGCGETYPGGKPVGCWGQSAGGYGDGLGTGETGGRWVVEDSTISYNTSDGLDLLYLRRPGGSLTIRRLRAEGNAGDQVKVTGPARITRLTAASTCGFFTGKPFTHHVDACRSGGSAVVFALRPGDETTLAVSQVSGEGDCLMIAECAAGGGCTGAERVWVSDSSFRGGPEFGSGGDTTCLAWHDLPADPFRYANVIAEEVKVAACPPGVTCR